MRRLNRSVWEVGSIARGSAVPEMFAALVDDAGLFPPERLPMPAAVARHRADVAAGHPVLTQRFLCPASGLAGLRGELAPGESWRLGLVADTGLDGLPGALDEINGDPRLRLETIEVRLPEMPATGSTAAPGPAPASGHESVTDAGHESGPAPASGHGSVTDAGHESGSGTASGVGSGSAPAAGAGQASGSAEPDLAGAVGRVAAAARRAPDGATVYVELPLSANWGAAARELAARGMGAKIRCGGAEAALFPSAAQLTGFLVAMAGAQVRFKATAGLHHAVRYTDPVTGFSHHGFLNLLLAASRAAAGSAPDAVAAVLGEDDGHALAALARDVSPRTAASTRSLFVAYGSCSTSEPAEDLAALGLVEAS